jgi:PAS domain S-box-containing protein
MRPRYGSMHGNLWQGCGLRPEACTENKEVVAHSVRLDESIIRPVVFAKDPEMTLKSTAGVLGGPIERPFQYLLIASILVPLLALIVAGVVNRGHLIEVATAEASQTVDVLHEHTLKVLETQQLALAQMDDRTRGMSWEEIAASEALFQDLRRLVARLPQIDGAFLVRPDGVTAMTSRVFPAPTTSFADRDYFQVQVAADAGFFVGGAYIGRISGHPIFNVSQRRLGGGEGFDGVVGISLSVNYFTSFYRSIAQYEGATIALGRTDGDILAHYPAPDRPLTRFPPDGPAMRGLAAGRQQWSEIVPTSQDGIGRLFAFRRVQGYPLMVTYGIPTALIRQWWLRDLAAFAGFAALAAASLVAATLFASARAQSGKRAAEGLRTREAEFRASFELGAVGKVHVDPETGQFLLVNDTFCQMIGYSREELLGLAFADITHPDDLPADMDLYRRLLSGEIPRYRREKRHRRKDGTVAWVLVAATALRDQQGRATRVLGDILDITSEKAAVERLRESEAAQRIAKEEAQRASAAKSRFLAAASHDLRQPLQSLILFTGVLKGYVQGQRGEQALKHLEHGLGTMKSLLDSLLDVSKLDAGMVTPEITDVAISPLLDEIAASYAPIAAAKGVGWQVETCNEWVRSDWILLGRMMRNLVENAVRYTEAGHIRIACHRIEDRLRIEVGDSGIGIPPDHLDRVFEEFHQVGNVARDRSQGLGLGLAIVRRISNLLGHRIEAVSKPGEGSTFSIEMPLGIGEPVPQQDREGAAAGQDGRGRLALVVDDDTLVLDSLRAILTEWGYEVLTATDAEQAAAAARQAGRRPDIVIADYRLREGRTGMEAIQAIRALFDQPIPALILTGETDLEFQRKAAARGLGIAHKPVTPGQLGRVLDQQLTAAGRGPDMGS